MLEVKKKQILVKLIVLQAKRMGRKPAGEKKLSNAAKQKTYEKKDKLRKRKSREKFMKDLPLVHKEKVKQESKRRKERRQKIQQTTTLMRNHWSSIWSFLHFLEVWNELKVACIRTEPKNELLLKHCLRTLSQ